MLKDKPTRFAYRFSWMAIALLAGSSPWIASAHADIGVDFQCSIPATSSVDCTSLKRDFYDEKALPFVKEAADTPHPAHQLQVAISAVYKLNGFEYVTTVSEPGKDNQIKTETYITDVTNPISARQQLNEVLKQGVLAFAKPVGETVTQGENVTMTYTDPSGTPSNPVPQAPKGSGRWALTPNVQVLFSGASQLPFTYSASGGAGFNYSGDHTRYQLSLNGNFAHQSEPVVTGNSVQNYGVQTYSAGSSAAIVQGLDQGNHFNFGFAANAGTNPVININLVAGTTIGIEYNAHPMLSAEEPDTLAVGCNVGPTYYNFSETNTLNQQQLLAISQGCAIAAAVKFAMDTKNPKNKNSSINVKVGESWLVNEPSFVSVSATLGATLQLNDRVSLSPQVGITWQTQSIATASQANKPNLMDLTPQQTAEQELLYASRTQSGAALSGSGMLMLNVALGGGVNRALNDQRGIANH